MVEFLLWEIWTFLTDMCPNLENYLYYWRERAIEDGKCLECKRPLENIKIFLNILTVITGFQREIRITSGRLSNFAWLNNPVLIHFIFWIVWCIIS